jgi:hypothetical protein
MSATKTTAAPYRSNAILDLEMPPLSASDVAKLRVQPGGESLIVEYEEERARRALRAEADPLKHGFELPHWGDIRHLLEQKDELYMLGANGSAKTHFGGKITVEKLVQTNGAKVLCVARSEDDSKSYQQTAVYMHLPPAARAYNSQSQKKRNVVVKINYSVAGGFTEGNFVLPNRSQCWFKTLAQYERDPLSFEGPEYDLVWIDEGAVIGLVDTLRFRVAKRAGKMLFTFTAIHGYDAVCGQVLEGARVVKALPMNWDWLQPTRREQADHLTPTLSPKGGEGDGTGRMGAQNPDVVFPELKMTEVQVKGLAPGEMPYIMQPLDFNKGIIFTWTHWNPFLPRGKWNPKLPAPFDKCVGRAKWQVRVRLFGFVEKMAGAAVNNFNPSVHVVENGKIAELLKGGKLTTYMSADPAGRSYFLMWAGVAEDGQIYIFDESPRLDEGEWVTMDGDMGDGQKVYQGVGVNWYKRHIREREREHGTEAARRFGDPRFFATEVQSAEGGQNLFDLFERDGGPDNRDTGYTAEDLAPMIFEPAKIRQTARDDVEILVDLLAYDTEREINAENRPRLLISDRCRNTIQSWINWNGKATGDAGKPNPYKDPVDCGRYLFGQELYWLDPSVAGVAGGGGWG